MSIDENPGVGAAPVPPVRRRYSDDDRRAALRVVSRHGGNLTRASRELGIDVSLLHRWQRRFSSR